MGKKSRQLFEDAMFSEGFFVTDINSIDKRFKFIKKGNLENEVLPNGEEYKASKGQN